MQRPTWFPNLFQSLLLVAGLFASQASFADPVPVPDDAPLFARALAHSGRDPRLSVEQRSGT